MVKNYGKMGSTIAMKVYLLEAHLDSRETWVCSVEKFHLDVSHISAASKERTARN